MINEIQFILYQLPDEEGKVQVVIKDETIWATQKAMAQLFDCSTDNIGLHLKNIFASGELDKDSVTEKISEELSYNFLFSRCGHCRRLPCLIGKSHQVPHLGNQSLE